MRYKRRFGKAGRTTDFPFWAKENIMICTYHATAADADRGSSRRRGKTKGRTLRRACRINQPSYLGKENESQLKKERGLSTRRSRRLQTISTRRKRGPPQAKGGPSVHAPRTTRACPWRAFPPKASGPATRPRRGLAARRPAAKEKLFICERRKFATSNWPSLLHDDRVQIRFGRALHSARFANGSRPVPFRDAGLHGRRDRR